MEVINEIEKLREYLINNLPDIVTSVNIFINCQGCNVKINVRTPGDLKSNGISMQNIQGNFIK